MKYFYLILFVFISSITSSQTINIPDSNFKNALIENGTDLNNDGEIQISEAEELLTLNIINKNITSLQGIEYFINLTRIDAQENSIETLNLSPLTNLEVLSLYQNNLISIDLESLSKLEYIYIQNNNLNTLKIEGLTNLIQLDCSYNSLENLDVSTLTKLNNLNTGVCNLDTLILGSLNNLETLLCHYNELTVLDITELPNLSRLACNNNSIETLNVTNLLKLENFNCQSNPLTALNLDAQVNLKYFSCGYSNLTNVDVSSSIKLESFNCGNTSNLTTLTLKNNSLENSIYLANTPNLSYICADEDQVNTLRDLVDSYGYNCTVSSNCTIDCDQIVSIPDTSLKDYLINYNSIDSNNDNIPDLKADFNNDGEIQTCEAEAISNLIFSEYINIIDLAGINAFTNLKKLDFGPVRFFNSTNPELDPTEFNFTSLSKLETLKLNHAESFRLEHINLSGLANLSALELINIHPTDYGSRPYNDPAHFVDVNLAGCHNLKTINYYNSYLNINFCQIPNLENLDCSYLEGGEPEILDLSCLSKLKTLDISENSLKILILKNGSVLDNITHEQIGDGPWYEYPNYICIDDNETEYNMISGIIGPNTTVNSFCSFAPGGNYYSVNGNINIDTEGNGCTTNPGIFPNLKFIISDGTNSSTFIADKSGNYNFPLQEGTYTITPALENPDYLNISPSSQNITITEGSSTITQNYCITPNGTKNDLEITIIPLSRVRPGFNVYYDIVYKNIGNTLLSGTIDFTYQGNIADFVYANPNTDSQSENTLVWNYNNLKPFESKTIRLGLNINSPIEHPSVNNGDVLSFTSVISPTVNDEDISNNSFTLNQTAVGSYDPNDKTCLEGNTITPNLIGEYVHYLIRCENTGTAEAVNIVITDNIDSNKFDINSLIVTNSSHSMTTEINENEVKFVFENINLPFDDANNDGYVAFKIKTLPTLNVGDHFENNADIFFDYNAPIRTNTTQTAIETTLSAINSNKTDFGLSPNPTNENITIESKAPLQSIQIYHISGKLINQRNFTDNGTLKKEISVKHLINGVYFLTLKTESNSVTKKLIKN